MGLPDLSASRCEMRGGLRVAEPETWLDHFRPGPPWAPRHVRGTGQVAEGPYSNFTLTQLFLSKLRRTRRVNDLCAAVVMISIYLSLNSQITLMTLAPPKSTRL